MKHQVTPLFSVPLYKTVLDPLDPMDPKDPKDPTHQESYGS